MVTRKNVGKAISKKLSSIKKASPEQIGHYAGRAALNVAKGTGSMMKASEQLAAGDYKGAAQSAHSAAKTVIGQKTISAAGKVALGKKGVGIVNRANTASGQAMRGDLTGAASTAMGKKASDRVAHHLGQAKFHADNAAQIHAATTGSFAAARQGSGSGKPM